MAKTSPLSSAEAAQRAAQAALDLKGVTDMADYFLIASGTSDTHVRAIAQNVVEELDKVGVSVQHEEGLTQGRWALLDYVDANDLTLRLKRP